MTMGLFPIPLLAALALEASHLEAADDAIRITDKLIHLGDNPKPEWKDFTTVEPEHPRQKEIEFEAHESKKELVLEIHSGGVGQDWKVKLNNQEIGLLEKKEPLTEQFFKVPASCLRDGKNHLLVIADKDGDDIFFGKARIHDRPITELKGHARVRVRVRAADSGINLPCRITIVRKSEKKEKVKDKDGKEREQTAIEEKLVEVSAEKKDTIALRTGIIYARDGIADFGIAPGECTLYASRGFEYGVAEITLTLGRLEERVVDLSIRREVDTTGFLAADTHIHTKTYSGHGDITMEERVVAIAGEGVEVAIATDHNHNTDYRSTMGKVGIDGEFTSIIGNEVTTSWGHFNAFPFEKGDKPPEFDHSGWVQLIQAMRDCKSVRAVILNHPRRVLDKQSPFDRLKLNPVTGELHSGLENIGVDAIEVLNGKTLEDDRLRTVKDWFGLLNRGYRMKAVAGSDSHFVSDVVGQTRTYVASSTDDPRKLQLQEFCDNFLAGRLLVSMGLLTSMEINGKYVTGDLATKPGEEISVKITVRGPSWTRADRVELYSNGALVRQEKVEENKTGVKYDATWQIPMPAHDVFLVALASGPAVTAPYWPIAGGAKKYVMGLTNPIWIDNDGDGKFTSAFEYGTNLVQKLGVSGEAVEAELEKYDVATAMQFASLARARIQSEAQEAYEKLMTASDQQLSSLLSTKNSKLQKRFSDYVAAAPKVEVRTRQDREDEIARLKKEEEARKKRREEEEKKRKEEEEKKSRRRGRV